MGLRLLKLIVCLLLSGPLASPGFGHARVEPPFRAGAYVSEVWQRFRDQLDNDATPTTLSTLFDAAGNTTNSSGALLQWDWANRLTNASSPAIQIVYDAEGNRVKKISSVATNLYLVDTRNPTGYAQVIEELSIVGGATNLTKVYTPGIRLISQRIISGSVVSFYGTDGHGSVRFLTRTNGVVSDTYAFDAFGNLTAGVFATSNNFLYCGEQWDPELGRYFLRARYYEPGLGRFSSMDSFEGNNSDPNSLHKYLYCHDDPINRIDPSGHFDFNIVGLTSALGIEGAVQAMKSGPEAAIHQSVRSFGRNLAESLSFEDKDANSATEIAAERLWAIRMHQAGLTTINLSASIKRHGPDMVAFGYAGGKYRLIIGEVKGMKRSRVLSALDKLEDGAVQMSASWLDRGLSTIADGLVAAIEGSVGIAGLGSGAVMGGVRSMLAKGELDLYLLRARDLRNNTWQLKAFRLMHVDGDPNAVGRGVDGAIPQIESPTIVPFPSVF